MVVNNAKLVLSSALNTVTTLQATARHQCGSSRWLNPPRRVHPYSTALLGRLLHGRRAARIVAEVDLRRCSSRRVPAGAFKAALETSALELKPKEVQALMACVDSEDGVTFAYVPLCEYAFRILEHLYREEAYHSRVQP